MRSPRNFRFDPRQSEEFFGVARTDKSVYSALDTVRIAIARRGRRRCDVHVLDADYNLYAGRAVSLQGGKGSCSFVAGGSLGTHTALLRFDDGVSRRCFFRVEGETRVETGRPEFDDLQSYLKSISLKCAAEVQVGGRRVSLCGRAGDTTGHLWFRDGGYGLFGYLYWHPVLKEFCDFFLATQDRYGFFQDSFYLYQSEWGKCYGETDLEYVAALVVHRVWQATGDDDWLRSAIPRLERGLRASMRVRRARHVESAGRRFLYADLNRWDPRTRLIKRLHTTDTWDFALSAPDGTPVYVIANCDQSGYFLACRRLGEMLRYLGERERGAFWLRAAARFRRQANRILWDGSKYRHHVHLDALDHGTFREDRQLSMGNIWAVNRGLADHRQAVRILREFRTRWRKTGDAWPWWSLQPGYPDGTFPATRSGEWNILQGVYANGGLIPWVGGELALAALEHGWEGFGVEQIRLYHDLLRRTRGGTNTWYWRDGRPGLSAKESSDHSVWDIGAWMRALQEGVGGIQDVSKSLERVLCSPRWEAAGVREATVVSRYAGTNSYFGYRVRRVGRIAVEIDYAGSGSRARFFVLLPKGRRAHAVTVDGRNVGFATQRVEESAYCSFRAGIRKTAAANSVRILMGRKMADTVRLPATPFSLNRVRIDLE